MRFQSSFHGREKSQFSKDGSGLPNPPRILQNLWCSAGGFCGTFCIVENLLQNWEPSPACRTLQTLLQLITAHKISITASQTSILSISIVTCLSFVVCNVLLAAILLNLVSFHEHHERAKPPKEPKELMQQ